MIKTKHVFKGNFLITFPQCKCLTKYILNGTVPTKALELLVLLNSYLCCNPYLNFSYKFEFASMRSLSPITQAHCKYIRLNR